MRQTRTWFSFQELFTQVLPFLSASQVLPSVMTLTDWSRASAADYEVSRGGAAQPHSSRSSRLWRRTSPHSRDFQAQVPVLCQEHRGYGSALWSVILTPSHFWESAFQVCCNMHSSSTVKQIRKLVRNLAISLFLSRKMV